MASWYEHRLLEHNNPPDPGIVTPDPEIDDFVDEDHDDDDIQCLTSQHIETLFFKLQLISGFLRICVKRSCWPQPSQIL
jgi:hypothetical protein